MPDSAQETGRAVSPAEANRVALMLYGVVQSALTTGIATMIGSWRLSQTLADFLFNWATSWLMAWLTMLPVVIFASPAIRRAVEAMIRSWVGRRRAG